MTVTHVAALAAIPLLAALACRPVSSTPPDASPPFTIALEPYFQGLRSVRLDSAAGRLRMLVDTGGGATLVVPAVAERLGCLTVGRDVGHRMTGETVAFERCARAQFTMSGIDVNMAPLGVFDVNALLPAELPRVDGVLALDAFRGRLVTFDWPADAIRVHGSTTGPIGSVTVRIATGSNGRFFSPLVLVEGTAGATLWFLLDSGNLRGTLVDRHVLDQGLLPTNLEHVGTLTVVGLQPRGVTFAAGDLIIDGALGVDTLLQGPVTLDLRRYSESESRHD